MSLALWNMTTSYGIAKLNDGLARFNNWKKANVGVLVIFIVAIFILGVLGLGVVAYCAFKGMDFDFALSMNPWTIKIGCRK